MMNGFLVAGLVGIIIGFSVLVYIALYQEEEIKKLEEDVDRYAESRTSQHGK